MTSPPSSSDSEREFSAAFESLHPRLQRWIWEQQWPALREIQERACGLILAGSQDVLIAAATAGGKTEAAFLPALSKVASQAAPGVRILGAGPLKALINDQFRRLEAIGDGVQVPVHRWHGDVAAGQKAALIENPSGVLLITPESLEAMFIHRGTQIRRIFDGLAYVIVDELHAFIGTERGRQLQSLLHRIEIALGRRIPRVGLSATLGDMDLAAEFLRPGEGAGVARVCSTSIRFAPWRQLDLRDPAPSVVGLLPQFFPLRFSTAPAVPPF